MNLVHLSSYSIDISTIRLIQWSVDETTHDNRRLIGIRVYTTNSNFFLYAEDHNYLEDAAKLREAVGN